MSADSDVLLDGDLYKSTLGEVETSKPVALKKRLNRAKNSQ
jgi:hypothetical protein